MRLYMPATEQQLVEIEQQVQEALASTLDFHLKRPEKLRELTCRILGYPNGYQQLKEAMSSAEHHADPVTSELDEELEDFLDWMRTTTEDVMSMRDMLGVKPRDIEQFLVEIMDEVVYDLCGTGKHVSDGINNQGLEVQVQAVKEAAGTFEFIIRALEDEMPDMLTNPYSWKSWRFETLRIPKGMRVYIDKESGEWAWCHEENQVHSWDFTNPDLQDLDVTFAYRSEAVQHAIDYSDKLDA